MLRPVTVRQHALRQKPVGCVLWLAVFGTGLAWSAINPKDITTWWLEVLPALIGVIVLALTRRSFALTPLVYWLILVHMLILMVGGHYTYAEVPLFDDLKSVFGFTRNNYDKVGHFAQGFVPAMVARELLIRKRVIQGRGWLAFLVVCVCLALSASYELVEWGVAVTSEEASEAFLGTQGYVWDTQSDMAFALIGAGLALLLLTRWHDRQLVTLTLHR